jgi:hypothetical protein
MTARSDAVIYADLDLHQHHPSLSAHSYFPIYVTEERGKEGSSPLRSAPPFSTYSLFSIYYTLVVPHSPYEVPYTLPLLLMMMMLRHSLVEGARRMSWRGGKEL